MPTTYLKSLIFLDLINLAMFSKEYGDTSANEFNSFRNQIR